jgi:hypothetical protein
LDISLHPDFFHVGDVAPHYDMTLSDGSQWRWYEGNWFQLKGPGSRPLSQEELNNFQSLNPATPDDDPFCGDCDAINPFSG